MLQIQFSSDISAVHAEVYFLKLDGLHIPEVVEVVMSSCDRS